MDTSVDQLFKERDLTITPTTILEEPSTGMYSYFKCIVIFKMYSYFKY